MGNLCIVGVDPGISCTGIVVVTADLETILKAPQADLLSLIQRHEGDILAFAASPESVLILT